MTVAVQASPQPSYLLLGQILVQHGKLRVETVDKALEVQREQGGLIGEILVRMKAIDGTALAQALATQSELPFLDPLPTAESLDTELIEKIPIGFAKAHEVLPLQVLDSGRVQVAFTDPLAVDAIDDIGVMLGFPVEPFVAPADGLVELINKVYGRLRQGAELDHQGDDDDEADEEEDIDLLDLTDEAPIIRWINSLLFQAVKEQASDIHIEPGENQVQVRYRVDGALRVHKTAPSRALPQITARVKIMAGLNIAEKRLPQDGRIRRKIGGKDIDMRVATVPTSLGERVTIRLLDRSKVMLGLPDIGMSSHLLVDIRKIISRPHGILLVTGPTGSGKTTTLYSALNEINSPDLNILTVEDPVEYQLEGISQTQVNSKIDLTFASGLRSFLRHDPNVIMVGEIRDRETAEIAITASLTGHLVFSTIHTNDAAGGITRLVDMGIEPFLVASSVVGLMAQRLVRRPCPECAIIVKPDDETLNELGLDKDRFMAGAYDLPEVKGQRVLPPGTMYQAKGCGLCLDSGYKGRTGIYELLLVSDAVRGLTLKKADASAIRDVGMSEGMVTLRMDGAQKCMLGMTTPEEVLMTTAEGQG